MINSSMTEELVQRFLEQVRSNGLSPWHPLELFDATMTVSSARISRVDIIFGGR